MSKPIYLVITTYFPTPEEPWRCAFIYDQVRAIRQATDRYEIVVLRPDRDGEYVFRGVRVIGFRYHTAGGWICPWVMNLWNIRKMWKALRASGLNVQDISVAHGHLIPMATYVNALKKKNRKIKAVLQFHDADPYGMLFGTGRLGWWKRIVYFIYHRALAEKMDMLIAISQNVAKVIAEAPRQTVFNTYEPMQKAMHDLRWFGPAQVKSVYLLHNGVNRNIFQFASSPDQRSRDCFVVGCIAMFRDLKDQLTLLKAVDRIRSEIPNMRVKLVGVHHSGTMFADCQRLIERRKLPVEIIPSINHESLPDFYRSLDLFVLPSYFEGFGCVFTEAWCCGTPFITCEGQGMDDFIYPADRHLWLCKVRDSKDLAKKIFHYYQNRPKQRLAVETDIDVLVPKFLIEVGLLKNEVVDV